MSLEDDALTLPYNHWESWKLPLVICVMKMSSIASIVGSSFIVYQILKKNRSEHLGKFYNRIMLCLSSFDIVGSFALFIASWTIPADALDDFYYGNIGTFTTCDIQGFLVHLSMLSAMNYRALLSVYFLLAIRYNWSENRFRKFELLWHLVAISFPCATAAYSIKEKLFNPSLTMCWIQSYPLGCETSDKVKCIRGGDGNIGTVRLIFVLLPVTVAFIFIAASMILLNRFVIKQRLRAVIYSSRFTNRRQSEENQKVFQQSCWYVGAFLAVWIPVMIQIYLGKNGIYSFTSMLIMTFLFPLQGFSYSLIYTKYNSVITEYISSALRQISRISFRSMSIASARGTDQDLEDLKMEVDNPSSKDVFRDSLTELDTPPLKCNQQYSDEEEGQISENDPTNHINLIPMGAYLNIYSGEYDSFLLSYINDDTDHYRTFRFIYREKGLFHRLEQFKVKDKPKRYDLPGALECDIWFEPKRPILVKHDGIVLERDAICDGSGEPGYALKSPSFQRFCTDEEKCITISELTVIGEKTNPNLTPGSST